VDTVPFARLLDDVVIWEWDAAADRIVDPQLTRRLGVLCQRAVDGGTPV
jgi:hypothetical protein